MGYGWALIEKHGPSRRPDGEPQLRNCRIPAFADVPHNELFFAGTHDTIGPLGAKSQGECAINPVAPAVSNALANATGVRFADLPFTPDRLFHRSARRTGRPSRDRQHRHPDCVRPESAQEFARWQGETSTVIAGVPGFIEQRLMPPKPPLQVAG